MNMVGEIRTFEDLEVWKRGCQLAVDVYVAFNNSKDFAMKNQVVRSSLSISSNIAEGNERDTTGDYIRFLRIAKGSCGELRTQLFIAQKVHKSLSLPEIHNIKDMIQETREISRMLQALINSLEKRRSTIL